MLKRRLLVLFVIITIIAIGVKVYSAEQRQTQWERTRGTTTVYVSSGDTLDSICYEYKPDWIGILEYRYDVMQLNGMTSAELYAGQCIDVYIPCTHYTVQGLCTDDTILTVNDYEWQYDTNVRGCVDITFSDNGTANDISDDIIISIEPIE